MTYSLQLTKDHAVPVTVGAGGTTITVLDGDTVYYGDLPSVSSTSNQGSLTNGQSFTITDTPLYARSASVSNISVNVLAASTTSSTGLSISSSASGLVGTLQGAGLPLSTGGPITSLPVTMTGAISQIAAGFTSSTIPFRLVDPVSGNSSPWTATATVPSGATSIPVSSQTPNFAYPAGTQVYAQPSITVPSPNIDARYRMALGGRFGAIGASYAAAAGGNSSVDPTSAGFGSGLFAKTVLLSNGLLRPKVCAAFNAGNDGTGEVLSKVGQVINAGIDLCLIDPGVMAHDIGVITLAQTLQNLTTLYRILLANKIIPVQLSLPAKGTGVTNTESDWLKYCYSVENLCADNQVPFVDIFTSCTTGHGSAWATQSGINLLSADTSHPSELGHTVIAQAIWTAIKPIVPPTPFWLTNSDSDPWNMLANGTFVGGAGGVPTSWSAIGSGGTSSLSQAANANVPGQALTIDISVGAGGATKGIQQAVSTGFNAGDTILFTGRLVSATMTSAANGANTTSFSPQVVYNPTPSGVPKFINPIGATGTDFTGPCAWYMQGTVPTGTTSITVKLLLANANAGVDANVVVGQVGLMNLTSLGIAD